MITFSSHLRRCLLLHETFYFHSTIHCEAVFDALQFETVWKPYKAA